MGSKINTVDKWLPAIATLWFFVALDSIIVWNFMSSAIHLFTAIGIIYGSIVSRSIVLSNKYRIACFLLIIYLLWIHICLTDNLGIFVKRNCVFIPFILILFWNSDLLNRTYKLTRKTIIFFAIGGTVVSILTLTGLISLFPYYVLSPQEALQERLGVVYHVYGVFVTLHDPLQLSIYRACGMMREPGHFAVILGFFYLIDRFQGRKVNIWIIIGGLLTFSSNFVLFFIFTELHTIFKKSNIQKVFKYLPIFILGIYLIFIALPQSIQDQIIYLAYERNLESVMDAMSASSSMDEALDQRASYQSSAVFYKMTDWQRMVGLGRFDTSYSLSDYRGMIMSVGFIGIFMSFLLYLSLISKGRKVLMFSLLLVYILIILHRAWMLYTYVYIYYLAFIAVVESHRLQLGINRNTQWRRTP